MRSAKADQLAKAATTTPGDHGSLYAGQTYLERLGILYMDEVRLTIVMELFMREMGPRQFYETIGGTSYDSIRRHFLKLVETGWLRKVRTVSTGRGRPEALYRATEQAVIDTETWRTIPASIRDAFTVMLLEEMGSQLGAALKERTATGRTDRLAEFKILEIDEFAWREAHDAVERCFQALGQEQIDAKIRLEATKESPLLMIVNLGAFEAAGPHVPARLALPKIPKLDPLPRWPHRIGRVFTDRLDLAIIDQLNHAAMTPAQLHTALGGTSTQGFLRRCKRLAKLGWIVNTRVRTGGALRGANVYEFRAVSPNVSVTDVLARIPRVFRAGRDWEAMEPFIVNSVAAVDAGAFNSRPDRHLTMSPLLVDETGWKQVTRALQRFKQSLLRLEADLALRRRTQGFVGFPAGFLLSCFESPLREMQQ